MSAVAAEASPAALAGRTVLVSGAAGGLGEAASLACARAGARVVVLGRRVPKLNRLLDAVSREGGDAVAYPLDLEGASPDDYVQLAERIGEACGGLHGLLHCAAHFRGLTPLAHTDPADFARALHVNLTARWWLTQACLPLMTRAPDAAVVFALDDRERVGQAYWGGYGIAQHGLAALVGMLSAELANSTVRIARLQPGPMRTPLRARAYAADEDRAARHPGAYAQECVRLLSPAGEAPRERTAVVPTP